MYYSNQFNNYVLVTGIGVLADSHLEILQSNVRDYLCKDYVPHGSPVIVVSPDGKMRYFQAMVLPNPDFKPTKSTDNGTTAPKKKQNFFRRIFTRRNSN
jgi:hypothetical protein